MIVLIAAFGIGFVGGLRSMTAPAVVAWAAHLGWMNLSGSPLGFMSSVWSVGIFTACALGEFVGDLLPAAPPRTSAFPLAVRIIVGALTGACVAVGGGVLFWLGALAGVVGAIVGAFAGYRVRTGLVRSLGVADIMVAIPEDLIAVGLGFFFVSRY